MVIRKQIISRGDSSGNGMIVRFQLPSGLDVISFPTENPYGGQWDLGPTWNYVVMADRPFLVDTGRWGQGKNLMAMMKDSGFDPDHLDFVLITHGHEDHDGGLAEVIPMTGLHVKAHLSYDILRKPYPDMAPEDYKKYFPAKCWRCFMPESFYTKHCLGYHGFLKSLNVDGIGDGTTSIGTQVEAIHLPGHSPDCMAVKLGEEGIIVGDIILPDITPWPTSLEMYDMVKSVLNPLYNDGSALFGLSRYVKSLKELMSIGQRHPDMAVFPAHRFYYNDQWNCIHLVERVKDLLEHHIQRCSSILDLISSGFAQVDEIAVRHFEPSKLKGAGIHLARNEIISHCELMIECGDLIQMDKDRYSVTGNSNFVEVISP